ncbi:SCP-2 sterol transfer family protein [Micromonospora rhizosphaerae]|uniref:SCP-2 sterol transfer family protein n=1 Tax=Micromonospora rhizosphaerae TaxID=568872 RepID=A0A1C6S7B9_9ACTN|nr:SCP2 sterol-binding domain-containing protein [Micromonospora rhizosphaerae]SCL25346.1 SCP-2 sterol transfer family protein [Micromonospora rhizosphaerae]
MSDPTAEFFARLGRRGHEPLLEEVTGTIRFDLAHEHGIDRWFLEISQGDLRVSREEREVDCVIRTSRDLFDRLAKGQEDQYAAWVRNEIRAEGEARLAYLLQRVLPGPPGAHHPRAFAPERRGPA